MYYNLYLCEKFGIMFNFEVNKNYNSDMDLKEIGELVKKRREFLNLRQEDLSELSEINMRTIHLIEEGRGNPSFKTLSKLAKVVGMNIEVNVKIIK